MNARTLVVDASVAVEYYALGGLLDVEQSHTETEVGQDLTAGEARTKFGAKPQRADDTSRHQRHEGRPGIDLSCSHLVGILAIDFLFQRAFAILAEISSFDTDGILGATPRQSPRKQ